MPKYRKKPVVIEARRVPVYSEYQSTTVYVDDCIDLAAWCGGVSHMMRNEEDFPDDPEYVNHVLIQTLEGDMKALPGDFVVKGVNDEFYPCKPNIFEKTYESVGK